jgi:flagellar FliL protein
MAEIPVLEAAPKKGKADKAEQAAKGDKAEKSGKSDKPEAGAEGAAAGGKKRLILFIAIGVVALGGLGGGAWFMFGGKADEAPAAAETDKSGKSAKAEKGKKGKAAAAKEEDENEGPAPEGPPQFHVLDPPFVVNFEAQEAVRFLQVSAQVMSRDLETLELLKASDPIIRNDMLLLLGNQKYETISTLEGKEKLRVESLEVVRKIVKQGGGKPKRVEAVYFTSFVMQ